MSCILTVSSLSGCLYSSYDFELGSDHRDLVHHLENRLYRETDQEINTLVFIVLHVNLKGAWERKGEIAVCCIIYYVFVVYRRPEQQI